jgi:hypothetical protein
VSRQTHYTKRVGYWLVWGGQTSNGTYVGDCSCGLSTYPAPKTLAELAQWVRDHGGRHEAELAEVTR